VDVLWNETLLRQILLITDGCSNAGSDPVYIAQLAKTQGVSISVVGVIDDGNLGEKGKQEAQNIADAGGGMCRIIRAADLSRTVQMMTRQTMQMTLHQVVNEELRHLVGQEADALPPATRSKVARLVETMSEEATVELALVVDVSSSMSAKMPAVREAIRDLEIGLSARIGQHTLVVVTYPGVRSDAEIHPYQSGDESLADRIGAIRPAGNTPTGTALEFALRALLHLKELPANEMDNGDTGSMSHYVI
jgi:Ca-activated chloride channel family protein